MHALPTGGRVVFGLPFIIFGLFHFVAGGGMVEIVPSYFPGPPVLWIYLAGIILLLGGVSIVANKFAKAGGLLLAALMLIFILTLHIPGVMNEELRQMAMVNLLKDAALLGGALAFAGMAPGKHAMSTLKPTAPVVGS